MRLKLFLLGLLVFTTCEEAPTSGSEEIELTFYTIDMGQNSGRTADNYAIRSEWEFQNLFGQSSDGFDFQDEMMIAVYKGEVGTTGNSYRISSVTDRGSDIRVTVVFEGCNVCNTATSTPYHIIGLDRSNKQVNFREMEIN